MTPHKVRMVTYKTDTDPEVGNGEWGHQSTTAGSFILRYERIFYSNEHYSR